MKPLYRPTIIAILLCATIFSTHVANAREFKDLKGRKINASVVDVTNNKAKLKLHSTGKIYTVPFDKLSKEDVEFLKSWKKQDSGKSATNKTLTTEELNRMNPRQLMQDFNIKENFGDNWPTIIKGNTSPEITTILEDKNAHKYIYHSPNYEFICNVKLSKYVVRKFAALFETTRNYCNALPLTLIKAHLPSKAYRNKIILFETYDEYIKNGGLPDSSGVYYSNSNTVFIPLTSLGVKKRGATYYYDSKGSNSTISHELTHQLTNHQYFAKGADGWFSEGLAEYVAMTPYSTGRFSVKSAISGIIKGVTEYGKKGKGGRALGKKIAAPDLKAFMLQPYSSFRKNGNRNYGLAALITCYFIHLDGNKDQANLNAFLKALNEGKTGEDALKVLLNGRSWDEMEVQISKAWRKKGIKITFG